MPNRPNIASIASLADVRAVIRDLPGRDEEAAAKAAAREAQLTKPAGALGRLEEITVWAAAWQGRHPPAAEAPLTCVFAGNHGVAARGVSAFPAEVTAQMVANFEAGGAAINQICEAAGARLKVVPLALGEPTADFTEAPAMSDAECAAAVATGMATVDGDADLLCVGEMGIANTTAAAALACALFGGVGADWAGPGTGVDGAGVSRKAAVVDAAMAHHGEALADPLEALRRVGGRELAAMTGAVIEARRARIPVLLDGYVCTAAAAVLHAAVPGGLDHCLLAHVSAEPGHRRLAERIGKAPLLDLGMRLGEGTGATLAAMLVRAALRTHGGMATFADAGVAERED